MRLLAVLFALLFSTFAVQAQTLTPVPSTPDISVTASATAEVVWTGTRGYVDWVYIKNDCPDGALYFDLRGVRDAAARHYPLRLSPAEAFSANMRVGNIVVSPDTANANTCTFTLMGAVK